MVRKLWPMLLGTAILLLAACGESTTAQPSSSTPTPTPKPVAHTVATSGPTTLGSPVSAFVGRYGQPNDHTDTKSGSYHFKRYSGSPTDFLIVQTDVTDQGYTDRVEGIGIQSSDTSLITAATCASFMPPDAKYQRQVQLTQGYDKIYASASLSKAFPADAFADASQRTIAAGLFDVQYLLRDGGGIDSCNVQVGTQQTQ